MCENSPLHYLKELIKFKDAEDTAKAIKDLFNKAFKILKTLLKICNTPDANVKTFKVPFLIL